VTPTNKQFRNQIMQRTRTGTAVEPLCPHVQTCGGCAFQDRDYGDQIVAKSTALSQIWQAAELPPSVAAPVLPIIVVPSPNPYHYRTRMDYVATKGRFGLRMRGRFNYVVELETCHLIPPAAFAVAHTLWRASQELALPDYNVRTHEGFLRYLVVRRSPQDTLLLVAVTASGAYETEMEQLATLALEQPGVQGFHWLLNETKTDLSFGTSLRRWGANNLPMQVGTNVLHVGPNSFFQNNVHLLLPLLNAVAGHVGNAESVIDLYGGVGTIALHLAPQVESVVCIESFAESAALARYNSALNHATNVKVMAEEVLSFLRRQLTARRSDLASRPYDVVIADPPRVGLGPEVCTELLRLAPRRIVYISCNPLTQIADLRQLGVAYQLTDLVGYDMFPHTPHIETLAVLDKMMR